MGVLPICWVTVSITTGGSLGCVRVDMVDVGGEKGGDHKLGRERGIGKVSGRAWTLRDSTQASLLVLRKFFEKSQSLSSGYP